MATATLLLCGLIGIALLFDFLNGLHDAANSIATIVSTRVLSPRYAVMWAAFFNFIAFMVFGLHVANTIGKGIVDVGVIDDGVIFGALMGAIAWNVITWLAGIPSSSSPALIGGLVGAGGLGHPRALGHEPRLAADQLDDHQRQAVADRGAAHDIGTAARELGAGDHLGGHIGGAEPRRRAAEGQVGDPGHRRDQDAAADLQLADAKRAHRKCSSRVSQ